MSWPVEFFVDFSGVAPVEKFLDSLSKAHRAKLLGVIKMLADEGPALPFPYASQVKGKLRELRTQIGKDKLRVLYFGDANRTFILLHALAKRAAQLPQEDIRIADARMDIHNYRLEEKRK